VKEWESVQVDRKALEETKQELKRLEADATDCGTATRFGRGISGRRIIVGGRSKRFGINVKRRASEGNLDRITEDVWRQVDYERNLPVGQSKRFHEDMADLRRRL
jgi:hypothetical protein